METSPTLDGRQIHQILQAVSGVRRPVAPCRRQGVSQHLATLQNAGKLEHRWLDPIVLNLSPCSCLRSSCSCSSWLRRDQSQATWQYCARHSVPVSLRAIRHSIILILQNSLEEVRGRCASLAARFARPAEPRRSGRGTVRISARPKWPLRTRAWWATRQARRLASKFEPSRL